MTVLLATLALMAPMPDMQQNRAHHKVQHKHHRVNRWKVVRPYNRKLERMAWCESTGRWFINTGNGFYGGLQFTLSTWRSVGGRSYPHQNSKLEQKYRAVKLIKREGYSPWPVCGYV